MKKQLQLDVLSPETETLATGWLAELINDASIDQIAAFDTDLKIIAWNKTREQITGISRKEAIGMSLNEGCSGMQNCPDLLAAIDMALKGFKSFVPWEKGSYSEGYFEHHLIPLKGNSSKVIGVMMIIHDVSHRIKAEQELKALNRALDQKNKELKHRTEELSNFNWIASHDLKEPLRKIYTFIEMVATKEGQKISDTARSNLRRAQSAVQRMGLLTDDIATFSEVAAPNEKLAEVSLQDALEIAKQKHCKMIEDSAATIDAEPLPTIYGYPLMLLHLWNHMLGNALKFHAAGAQPQVRITYAYVPGEHITHADADPNADYHCISFNDNGIGFAPEYAEKIFGMFQRLNPQGTYKGTGMGLPVCRKIAEAHEGFITAESEEGVGSTFSCFLKEMSER